jgi:hypothetical protein
MKRAENSSFDGAPPTQIVILGLNGHGSSISGLLKQRLALSKEYFEGLSFGRLYHFGFWIGEASRS